MKNTKEMLIRSVKLVNQGMKGIEITYAMPTTKNFRSFVDEHKSKKKAPIHSELEELFLQLKPYLLDCCDYPQETREKDLIETQVIFIQYSNEGFIIKGEKSVLQGDKTVPLHTPMITVDDYDQFGAATKIMDKIYDEVKVYMSGEKTLSDEQLVIRFNQNKEGFNIEEFKKLSKEEQRNIATQTLEKMGAIVIHSDEVGEAADLIEAEVSEEKEENPFIEEGIPSDDFDDFDEKKTPEEPKPGALRMIDVDGGFQVIANPIKQSTAKRVA